MPTIPAESTARPKRLTKELWEKERSSREEWENRSHAILELRETLRPGALDLIKRQRLGYLVDGTIFSKYSNKGQKLKDKFWCARLSPNHKMLYWGDCKSEHCKPTIEELPNKLPVAEIRLLAIGKDAPHMKNVKASKKPTAAETAFSILTYDPSEPHHQQQNGTTSEEPLNFIAPDEEVFDYWTDGINALLGREMTSEKTKQDLNMLLGMEVKIRLLDTEGVTIPEVAPEIPPPPPNFDFNIKF